MTKGRGKGKGRKVRQSTGGRVPSGVRYSGRDMRRYPSRSGDERRGTFVGRGSRKSGWHDEPRRHGLARMGIRTVLPDGRRLAVNNFVAGGRGSLGALKKAMDRGDIIVWDNGGYTVDRYTVLIDGQYVFTMSEHPSHPLGVNQFVGDILDWIEGGTVPYDSPSKWIRIQDAENESLTVAELPNNVALAIADRMESE